MEFSLFSIFCLFSSKFNVDQISCFLFEKKCHIFASNLKISAPKVFFEVRIIDYFFQQLKFSTIHLHYWMHEVLSDTGSWFFNKNFAFWQSVRQSQVIYELLCSQIKLILFWRNPWTIFFMCDSVMHVFHDEVIPS